MRVLLVNLERACERRERMAAEFARVGLEFELWPAVDARTLTDADRAFIDQDRRRRLGLYPIPDGSLANTLSQRAAMEHLVRNGPDMMAVFEDDARFDRALPEVLEALERRSHVFDVVKLQPDDSARRGTLAWSGSLRGLRIGRLRHYPRRGAAAARPDSPHGPGKSTTSFPGSGRAVSTSSTSTHRWFGKTRRWMRLADRTDPKHRTSCPPAAPGAVSR